MGWIKGTIVCFFIPLLTIYWSDGAFAVPSSSVSYYSKSSPFLGPVSISPVKTIPRPSSCSISKRQQLLNQASSLLKKLSPSNSDNPREVSSLTLAPANKGLEKIVIKNLADCLEALDKDNTQLIDQSQNPLIISKVTYDSILNQYRQLWSLVGDYLAEEDAQNVYPVLNDLYTTFNQINDGQLLNVQLPSLCTKILALNTQLEAIVVPKDLQATVDAFIESLTSALTGQSQVTISAICNCLNELETSIVTVVQNDKSEKLQALLTNLINAMINAVVSATDGCDVVEIVQTYVASINDAIEQDAKSRTGKIYGSVLNFEKKLSKVLIDAGSNANKAGSTPKTLIAPGSKFDPLNDVTFVITDGTLFVIDEHIEQLLDDDENIVQLIVTGTYKFVDPETNVSWSGSYVAQEGTIDTNLDGSIAILQTSLYDVNLPNIESSSSSALPVKRQGLFTLRDKIAVVVDEKGNFKRIEGGTYSMQDIITGSVKSGEFVVKNTITELNPDSSINIIKAGVFSVCDPLTPSGNKKLPSENGVAYFLDREYIFNAPDPDGNLGVGIYDMETLTPPGSESGDYVIQQIFTTENADGSTNTKTSGLFFHDGSQEHFTRNGRQEFVTDKYGHVTPMISGGVLTRTNLNTGQETFKPYIIQNINIINNPESSRITKFGKFIDNFDCASDTDCTPGTKLAAKQAGSSKLTPQGKPLQVSKNAFQALLDKFKLPKPNRNPSTRIKSVTGQTHPSQKKINVGPSSGTPNCGITSANNISPNYDATSIVTDNTVFIITEMITRLSNSEGIVIRRIEIGAYYLRDETTNTSWSGTFETTRLTKQTASQNKINTVKAGKFEVAPAFQGFCAPVVTPVEGLFLINDLVISESNRVLTVTENGTYSVTDTATAKTKFGNFVVMNEIITQLDNGVIEVVKAGFLNANNPDITSLCPDFPLKFSGRYFTFKDMNSRNPQIDGNNGTGVFNIKDSTTNEYVSGVYIIKERTIDTNPDGSMTIRTKGLRYTTSSNFDPITNSPDDILNVASTESFTCIDQLVTVRDVYGHTSTFGTGQSFQTNTKTGETNSITYEIKNFVTITNEDGTTSMISFGRIPHNAYQIKTHTLTIPTPIFINSNIYCTFENHVFGTPRSDGNYGTGTYKIDDYLSEEFVTGTYVITKRAIIAQSDGTVYSKTSGVIYVDSSRSSPTRTDIRLAISDGAQFILEETIFHNKDLNNNIIVTGTGLFTQIIPSTGLIVSTSFTIENSNVECSSDGAQDIIRSGPMDYRPTINTNGNLINSQVSSSNSRLISKTANLKCVNKAPQTSTSNAETVYFSITDLVSDEPDDDGNYGAGTYSFEKPATNEFVTGTLIIQERSSSANDDGTTNWKTSGVILIESSQLTTSNSDVRLTVVHGAQYMLEETVSYTTDGKNSIIVSSTGLLTQTDPTSGVIISTHYTIDAFDAYCVASGLKNITRSGRIDYTDTTVASTSSANPLKGPGLTSTVTKDDVSFEFLDQLYGTPRSDGNYGTGKYKINDLTTNELVTGTYVIQKRSIEAKSNGILNRKISGTIFIDSSRSSSTSSDARLAILDEAQYKFEETIIYRRDPNGNVIVSGTGLFTQLNPSSGIIFTSKYKIENFNAECNSDGSESIFRSGMMIERATANVIDKSTNLLGSSSNSGLISKTRNDVRKAPQTSTINDGTVEVSIADLIHDAPDDDGNHGTGTFKITKPTTSEFVAGTLIIQERSTFVNDDGTISWKTSGMISIDSSQLGSTSYDTRLTIVDGAQYTIEETVFYDKDVNDNVIVNGNGVFTQTDSTTAVIISTYYTINAFDANCNTGGYKNIIRSGTVDSTATLAYLTSSKPNANPAPVPGTGVKTNYVNLRRSDVIAALNVNVLQSGNIILLRATNGKALLANIQGCEDPITFRVITLADVIKVFASRATIWNISENDFSLENRLLIDAVVKEPCET